MSYNLVHDYFRRLGFEPQISDIYIALYTHGPQTISELARQSGVERTCIYRLVQKLEESNLIEVELQYKRRILSAAPINNLYILISKKEQELDQLKAELDNIDNILGATKMSSPATQIQFYQGIDGIKQMLWNQTKAKTSILSILHDPFQHKTKKAFFERWVRIMNSRGVAHRLIVDDNFTDDIKKWTTKTKTERTKLIQTRHVPSDTFIINHATFMYDDVVAYYNWKDGEVFGVEMRNIDIAGTHRQFFEMLWKKSKPVSV